MYLLLGRGMVGVQHNTVLAGILHRLFKTLAGQLIVPVVPGFHDNGVFSPVKLAVLAGKQEQHACHHDRPRYPSPIFSFHPAVPAFLLFFPSIYLMSYFVHFRCKFMIS